MEGVRGRHPRGLGLGRVQEKKGRREGGRKRDRDRITHRQTEPKGRERREGLRAAQLQLGLG